MREPCAVFVLFAAYGVFRGAPGVTTGDAGELAAVSSVLGVAHAPGYPLYALAGKAFGTVFPAGAWTHRMNVLSALLGAGALALLSGALERWGFSRPARLGAVAVLGLAPAWQESMLVTEVFALHGFLMCLLLWLCSHERAVLPGPAAAVGLVFGLALGNHHTSVLVLPAVLLLPGLRARSILSAAAGVVAGLTVYAYLPIRASANPPLDWGHAVDLKSFLHVLLRRDYGSFSLTTDGAAAASGLGGWARQAFRSFSQLGAVPVLLALAGAALWPASSRLPRRVALAWLLLAGPGFLLLGRPGWDAQTSGALTRFALLPLIGAALLAAAALERAGRAAPLAAAALAAFGLAAPASARQDFLAHDYGRALLDTLPPGALFVMDGGDDTFYSLAALRWAHGLRPDLELRDRGGVVFPGLYGPDFRSLTAERKERRRRAAEAPQAERGRLWYSTLNAGLLPGRELAAAGLLRRPLAPAEPFPEAAAIDAATAVRLEPSYPRYRERALAAFIPYSRGAAALRGGRLDEAVSWLSLAAELGSDALWVPSAAAYGLAVAGWRAMQADEYALGERAYRAWLDVKPDAEAAVNLGAALERQGRAAQAEAAYRAAMGYQPGAARPWAALGALEWSRGRWAESAAAFEQAAAREPRERAHNGWAAAARRKLAKR